MVYDVAMRSQKLIPCVTWCTKINYVWANYSNNKITPNWLFINIFCSKAGNFIL